MSKSEERSLGQAGGITRTCAVLRVREHPRGEGARAPDLKEVSGDNSLRDPPVPIPNTEVKPQHADSTWLETAR